MEPVLAKYIHVEGSIQFQDTELEGHQIVTGHTKRIRKPPKGLTFSIRKEMDYQVDKMLDKRFIEESTAPWSAPSILVPKISLDGKIKY